MIKLSDYEQLSLITWQRLTNNALVSEEIAFALYECGMSYIDMNTLKSNELKLINYLQDKFGKFMF